LGDFYKFTPLKNSNIAWKYFAPIIGNNFGTAGLVAGLYLRSGCDPFTGYENYIGNDQLELDDFAYDKKGFGMGRWKSWIRKQSLYNFARKAEEPIYDIHTQMAFIMDEFSGTTYGPVLQGLKDATSVREAAYLVYDKYLDTKKRSDEKLEICAGIATDIYNTYAGTSELTVPVKYVKTEKRLRVKSQRSKSLLQIARRTLGYLEPGELYKYVTMTDDGKEFIVHYKDQFGYVRGDKLQVITKMEAIK